MSLQGSQPLAVFLCEFYDTAGTEPQPADFFRQMFAARGVSGLNDWWIAASLGAINLDGSQVFGWRTLKSSKAAFLAAHPGRWDKISGGAAAFPEVDVTKFAGVVTIFNVDVGDAGTQNGVLGSATAMSPTFFGHETGHVFGLQHSFDQSTRKAATWSAPGEYFDRQDIMSEIG